MVFTKAGAFNLPVVRGFVEDRGWLPRVRQQKWPAVTKTLCVTFLGVFYSEKRPYQKVSQIEHLYLTDFLTLNENKSKATASSLVSTVMNHIHQLQHFHEYFGDADMRIYVWLDSKSAGLEEEELSRPASDGTSVKHVGGQQHGKGGKPLDYDNA